MYEVSLVPKMKITVTWAVHGCLGIVAMTIPESLRLSGISAHAYNAAFGAQFAIHDAISSMNEHPKYWAPFTVDKL